MASTIPALASKWISRRSTREGGGEKQMKNGEAIGEGGEKQNKRETRRMRERERERERETKRWSTWLQREAETMKIDTDGRNRKITKTKLTNGAKTGPTLAGKTEPKKKINTKQSTNGIFQLWCRTCSLWTDPNGSQPKTNVFLPGFLMQSSFPRNLPSFS